MCQPTPQRLFVLALLPLALLGLLPAWAVGLLCVLYAAGVWHAEWVQARLLGSLLIVGLVPLPAVLNLNVSDLRSVTGVLLLYVLCTGAVAALHWAAGELEDGRRRGIVPVLLVGLLAPQPGLVLALLGGLTARPGVDSRHVPNASWNARVWRGILLAAGAAVVLTAFLPRPGLNPAAWLGSPPASTAGKAIVPPPPPKAPTSEGVNEGGRGLPVDLVLESPVADRLLEAGGPLLLLLAVLVLIAVMRERGGGKPGKRHPAQVLMVAGLLLTLFLWLVAGLFLSVGGERGGDPLLGGAALRDALGKLGAGPTGTGDRASVNITPGALALLWALVGLTVLGILGVATHLLRARRRLTAEETDAVKASGSDESASLQAPVHRVRVAYMQAEQALASTGRIRQAAETPDGFATRLTVLDPALHSALVALTRAYLPVRYGGDLTDQDAEAAEQAVQDLMRLLPTLPLRLADPEDRMSLSGHLDPRASS